MFDYKIKTDYGNVSILNNEEIEELFYICNVFDFCENSVSGWIIGKINLLFKGL
jgi:hypothetical protein